MTKEYPTSLEGLKSLSEAQLDDLQWAKEFMERYERKHRLQPRFKHRGKMKQDDPWWKPLVLENGKLDDTKTTSEYERGYIDCWNENEIRHNYRFR